MLKSDDSGAKPSTSSGYMHIFDAFKSIKASNKEVRFINTYRGMPVSYSGKVTEIGVGRVEFYVPQPQIVCMNNDGLTYIKGPELLSTVRASVIMASMETERVMLRGFEYVEDNIGKRSSVRVEISEPLPSDMSPMGASPFKARIMEVSLRGLMAVTWGMKFNSRAVNRGTRLNITYKLPVPSGKEKYTQTEIDGVIMNLFLIKGTPEYRLGIKTSRDVDYERLVTQYISLRQRDLLREIKSFCTK